MGASHLGEAMCRSRIRRIKIGPRILERSITEVVGLMELLLQLAGFRST